MNWIRWNDEKSRDNWDINLLKFKDYSFFQTYKYGNYVKNIGYELYRFVGLGPDDKIEALFQCWSKTLFGVTAVVARGGPVGQIQKIDGSLQDILLSEINAKIIYCRCNAQAKYSSDLSFVMERANWRLNPFPKYSRWTLELDLSKSLDYLESNQSKNWKRNLRRSTKGSVPIEKWKLPNKREIIDLYTEMESYKGINRQFTENQISNILKIIGDDLIIYKSSNESGDIIGIRGCVIFGNKALDFFAATNQEGRSKYVSYGLLWQIIIRCKEIGIQSYDLHGIDIVNNKGVYNFKKGTGALLVENLGEYDWATSGTLRKFIHLGKILR